MITSKDRFSHLIKVEIEEFYNINIPDFTKEKQIVYILSRYFSGIFVEKLIVNYLYGQVIDYSVSYFF